MTGTVADTLVQGLIGRIAQIPELGGVTVQHGRTKAVTEFPALVLREGETSGPVYNSASAVYTIDLAVEGWVRAPTRSQAMALARAWAGLIQRAAMNDVPLGSGWIDTRDDGLTISGDHGAADQVATFELSLVIEYETAHGDPFAPGNL